MKRKELKEKIKKIEKYIGSKVKFKPDTWPKKLSDKWIMEYLILLKKGYYRRLKRK